MAKWANDYPVALLCRVLQVTKSAYYDWKQRGATVVGAEEFSLCSRLKALFAPGPARVWAAAGWSGNCARKATSSAAIGCVDS